MTELKYNIYRSSVHVITLQAAIKILENVYPINKPIEDNIYLGLNVAGVHPTLFNLAKFESTLNIGQISLSIDHFLGKGQVLNFCFRGDFGSNMEY